MSLWLIRKLLFFPLKVSIALLPLAPLFVPSSVVAGPRATLENDARKACLKGDYAKGVDILVDLFVETKNLTYIFNQGRCYEQNQQFKDAIGRFEEYMRAAGTKLSAEDRASAEKHIADCKGSLAREKESAVQPPPVVALPVTPAPEPKPQPDQGSMTVAKSTVAPVPAERRWGLITAGIATGAVGVGGIVVGVLMNAKFNQLSSDMESKPGSWSTKQESTQKDYKTLSLVGYGVGAACVLTGAILMGFGAQSSTGSSEGVAFLPMFSVGQAGAMLRGAF